MKSSFSKYLGLFPLSGKVISEIQERIDLLERLLEESVLEIHISEFIDNKKERTIQSAILLSDKYAFELKNIFTDYTFDIVLYKNNICYLEYKESQDKGVASLHIQFLNNILLDLRASNDEIEHLKQLRDTYFIPNFIRATEAKH